MTSQAAVAFDTYSDRRSVPQHQIIVDFHRSARSKLRDDGLLYANQKVTCLRHSPSSQPLAQPSTTVASTPVCSCAPAANDCCGPTRRYHNAVVLRRGLRDGTINWLAKGPCKPRSPCR